MSFKLCVVFLPLIEEHKELTWFYLPQALCLDTTQK